MIIKDKTIRKLVKEAINNGWQIHKRTKNGHLMLAKDDKLVTISTNHKTNCKRLNEIKHDLGL